MAMINVIFYKTPYDDHIIQELTDGLISPKHYHYHVSYEPQDIIKRLPTWKNGILLFYINSKMDFQEALVTIKSIKKFPHGKFFKFFSVLTYDYSRSEAVLKKLGCLGFFTPADEAKKVAKKIELLRKKCCLICLY